MRVFQLDILQVVRLQEVQWLVRTLVLGIEVSFHFRMGYLVGAEYLLGDSSLLDVQADVLFFMSVSVPFLRKTQPTPFAVKGPLARMHPFMVADVAQFSEFSIAHGTPQHLI